MPAEAAADPAGQAAADQAQSQRMQEALAAGGEADTEAPGEPRAEETDEQRERRLANEAWLRRIPDDPGGLLREKFRLEHERRRTQNQWEQ